MSTPYGEQPPGQQPPPGFGPPPGDGQQSAQPQQPFGQPQQSSPFGQPGQQQPQAPFTQAPGGPPPFGQPQPAPYGQMNPYGASPDAYAHWGKRLAAMLIDFSPILLIYIIGGIYYLVTKSEASTALGIAGIVFIGFSIWNRWILMGTTGQSLGKRYLKIKLVKETTGAPLGIGMTIVREFCHFLDNFLFGLGYWFPLWDRKRQTFSDKIVGTIVLPAATNPDDVQPFGGQPGFPAQPSPFGQPPQQFQQPQSGAFGQPPQQQSPFGQQPQQSQPFGQQPQRQSPFGQQPQQAQQSPFGQQPQGTAAPSAESQTEPGFGEAEPTQVLRPGSGQQAPSGFDEAEPTQKITPDQLRQQLPGADGPNQPGTSQH
ncbi:RDD family protein [Amycolatopsis sp. lyj-112]|uniref:RDD family protein n=1 Tax=Amycolatopsis sp. lyj-112 TaxID=2789288 RepID=UPI00397BC3E6